MTATELRLSFGDPPVRYVPPRPKAPTPVTCDTCLDHLIVFRIRGGQTRSEPCPDCKGGRW